MTKYIKIYRKQNILLLMIITIGAIAQIAAGILNARAFNALISFNWNQFIISMASIFLMLGIYIVSLLFRIPYETKVIQLMVTRIRTDIAEKLENTSFKKFHDYGASTFISWLNNDITTIEQSGYSNLYACITMIIEAVFAGIALFFFHWSIILYAIIISIITFLLPKLVQKRVQDSTLEMTKEQERFVGSVTSVLQGFDTLFSYNLVSRITDKVSEASENLAGKKIEQRKNITYSAVLGASGNVFGQAGVLILTGFLAFRQIVSIGSITATEALSNHIFNSIGNITNLIVEMRTVQPIFNKFKSVESIDQDLYSSFVIKTDNIALDNLNYCYNDNETLWKNNLSYEFIKGGKYAVVGPSGSGKSTLFNILNGKLVDYKGSLQIAGNEIAKTKGEEIRNKVMYVDQTPYIFKGSILENITLDEKFSNDEIWKALDDAGLKKYVEALPSGLNASVGENGRSLSGGQKQRLALARGLIRDKNIILIDEGTSSLDNDAALDIEKKLMKNKELTVIMITHNLRDDIRDELDEILDLSVYA